ncbi:MAG TPA: response regulator [Holophagaceae bacterium]|nr:response regulator [Holophagaceae bacterium]
MNELKRILLVEDNPNDVELAQAAFEAANLANEVVVTRDGAEALDYLFRRGAFANRLPGHPAVVLLDLKLPKVDGIEVLTAVRAEPSMKSLPVVMLTSSREEPDLKRCYALGVNAYVVKPVSFQDFIAVGKTLGVFWALINEPPPASEAPSPRTP